MASYEETFCQAMQLIAENAVRNAGYDKTIQATIISCEDKTTGCYKVQYQDNIFLAYSADTKVKYTKGNLVYILIPNSNFDNNKTILGSVTKMGSDYIDVTDEKDQYEIIGNNICQQNKEFKLSTYQTVVKVLYDAEASIDELGLSEFDAEEYLSNATYLMLTASIKTSITASQRYLGNYGLLVETEFRDNAGTDAIISKSYVLDVNVMTGNPYKYIQTSPQYNFYIANGVNFKRFIRISLFVKDFPKQKKSEEILPEDYDITISNIGIYAAKKNEADNNGYSVSFSVPQGLYFNEKQTDDKHITAIVKAKNIALTAESASMSYYWFIQDNSIGSDSPDYCVYGGRGWKCLNQYNVLQTEPEVREWLPATNIYTLSFDQASLYDNNIKVVILYNDIILEKTISIKNYNKENFSLIITSSNGDQFYFDNGNTILSCDFKNIDLNFSNDQIDYYWAKQDADGHVTFLDNNKKNLDVEIKDIINYSIFSCSIKINKILYGTAFYTIYNSMTIENIFHCEIQNGDQVFKYNENGLSPTSISNKKPQEIKPLELILFDKNGKQLEESLISNCAIEWKVPKENTLIKISNYDDEDENYYIIKNTSKLFFDINKNFIYNALNNQILVSIIYQNILFKNSTSLSFIKEGVNGTNGTDFFCRIVPNTKDDNYTYPYILYTKEEQLYMPYTGIFNEPCFKIQLYKDGVLIIDAFESSTDYLIEWSFLSNKYDLNTQEESSYTVDSKGRIQFNNTITDATTSNVFPANILQAKITYDGQIYYATTPLISITYLSNEDIECQLKNNSGFYEIEYSSSGINPKYDNTFPFQVNIVNSKQEEITDNYSFSWFTGGSYYMNNKWNLTHLLSLISNSNLTKNQCQVNVASSYKDASVNNAVLCGVSKDNIQIASIHIPIYFYLNRYSLFNLNEWNGNSTQINENGGFIFSPQIGAGTKNNNNQFTGIVMGEVKESNQLNTEQGLFGFYNGQRSIFLDAKTGTAIFGLNKTGQIIINPSNNEAIIQSGNYSQTEKTGMQINLSKPAIIFGSGAFKVNENGKLEATGASIAGSIKAESGSFGTGQQKIYIGTNEEYSSIYGQDHNSFNSTSKGFYLGPDGLSLGSGAFKVNENGKLEATGASITGSIKSSSNSSYTEVNGGLIRFGGSQETGFIDGWTRISGGGHALGIVADKLILETDNLYTGKNISYKGVTETVRVCVELKWWNVMGAGWWWTIDQELTFYNGLLVSLSDRIENDHVDQHQ